MTALSAEQVEGFERDGLVFPIRAVPAERAGELRARLEATESRMAGRLPPLYNIKAHLLLPWLWDLVQDARVTGPVADLLGPDLLCWGSSFFAKGPGEAQYVAWHQDATYWGLTEPVAVTAWIAFTPSTLQNGCLRVEPGSHRRQLPHEDARDRLNMLAGAEKLAVEVDEASVVDVVLEPGEMSLHHVLSVHGSEPNRGASRRIGFAIRYIPGHLAQSGGQRGTATLVRGRDLGGFDLEVPPRSDLDPEALARHAVLMRRWAGIVRSEVRATGRS
jgi:hypothetical protein